MSRSELRFQTVEALGEAYRSGELSPVDVAQAHLDAIEALNPDTHDYITVTAVRAIADARRSEDALRSGQDVGPLCGVPIALKDLVHTAGIPTTAGTTIWQDRVPDRDGTVARKLSVAGSVLLGKTNLVEFAFGPYGVNPHYGTPPNPRKADRVPGGSSSGSGAAVARGCAVAAIGTDTGGSIRLPAAFCGVVGLKPTVERVSRAGVVPLSWTLDSVGPLTRTVKDAAYVFDAIAGPDSEDAVTNAAPPLHSTVDGIEQEIRGRRIGVVRYPFFDGADAQVVESVDRAITVLADLGAEVEDVELPEAVTELEAEIDGRGSVSIMCVEGFACHRDTLDQQGDDVDPRIRERIEQGKAVSASDYALALLGQQRMRRSVTERLSRWDAVVAPTTLYTAPPIADVSKAPARLTTRLVNYLGLCSVSLPCGLADDGLPVGLQVIGKPFDERTILNISYAYEQASGWKELSSSRMTDG